MRYYHWCFFLVFISLVACQQQRALIPSKDLVVATIIPIGDVRPFTSRYGVGANLIDLLYRPLIKISDNGDVIPDLAQDFHWSEDYAFIKITLDPADVDNVLYTFDTVRKLKDSDYLESLKYLDSLERISPKVIHIKLKKFDRAFLNLLTQLPIISRAEGRFTGDFSIESQESEKVVLKRQVWSENKVNRIIVKQMSSARKSIRELVAGNVDLTFLASEWDFKMLTDIQEIQVGALRSRMLYVVLQNFNKSAQVSIPWAEINKKIDRKAIIAKMGEAGFTEAYLPIPPDDRFWGGSNPSSKENPGPMSGETKGDKVSATLSYLGKKSRDEHLALILKRHLEEMGIHIILKELTWETFLKELSEKKFDWILFPYNFRDTLMENWWFHSPEGQQSSYLSNYSNPRFDRFLEEARYSRDDTAAKTAFRNAMAELAEHPPGLFLFWLKTSIIYRKSCSGFKYNTNEFFSSLKDVRCEPSAAN